MDWFWFLIIVPIGIIITDLVFDRLFSKRHFAFQSALNILAGKSLDERLDGLQRLGIIKVESYSNSGETELKINFDLLAKHWKGKKLIPVSYALCVLGDLLQARPDDNWLRSQIVDWLVLEAYGHPRSWILISPDRENEQLQKWLTQLEQQREFPLGDIKKRCEDKVRNFVDDAKTQHLLQQIKKAGGQPHQVAKRVST